MNTVHLKIFGIIMLYCLIFAWMSVPFVTTDRDMLRRQVLFIDGLQEQIVADSAHIATP